MLRLRGKRNKVWTALWREDVLLTDGSTRRIRKQEVLGTLKEYKTRRLAERALEQRLAEVNSLTYKPRPTATFREFAAKWQKDVLTQFKPSTGTADRSRIRTHLVPQFGEKILITSPVAGVPLDVHHFTSEARQVRYPDEPPFGVCAIVTSGTSAVSVAVEGVTFWYSS